jgi:RNA-directed DNA polymerase
LNLPLSKAHKLIVEKWLKSGAVSDGELIDTDSGTPQGGIISPILANFTLNGLEDHVRKSISSISGGKQLRKNIYQNGVRTKLLSFNLKTVRYADDFVVLGTSKRILEQYVKPAVNKFLEERGLRLSPDKTKIFQMASGTELKFLGYVFKYRDTWSKKYSFFKDRIGNSGIALYPDKEKVKSITGKIKLIIDNSQNLTSYQLIAKLNPIIRG